MTKSNLHIIGMQDEESQENSINQVFKRITEENFPKLKKDIAMQV